MLQLLDEIQKTVARWISNTKIVLFPITQKNYSYFFHQIVYFYLIFQVYYSRHGWTQYEGK